MGNRVFVYVDGFNLYYRALKGSPFKWLDLDAFAYNFLEGAQRVEMVRYFTARVSGSFDSDAPRRQQRYLKAISTMPCSEIHYGSFLTKISAKPRATRAGKPGSLVDVYLSEEKGSDVNLGVHLVNDAHLDRFDVALVLSQDSDLLEPMRIAKGLGKQVGIIWLQPKTKAGRNWRAPSRHFKEASSFIKYARKPHYRDSQFDDIIFDSHGAPITSKPDGW